MLQDNKNPNNNQLPFGFIFLVIIFSSLLLFYPILIFILVFILIFFPNILNTEKIKQKNPELGKILEEIFQTEKIKSQKNKAALSSKKDNYFETLGKKSNSEKEKSLSPSEKFLKKDLTGKLENKVSKKFEEKNNLKPSEKLEKKSITNLSKKSIFDNYVSVLDIMKK